MSTFSRSAPQGGSKDGEKGDASSAASDKEENVEAPPPAPPAVVVSRVVNVSWERRSPTGPMPRVQAPPAPQQPPQAPPAQARPPMPPQRITAPLHAPILTPPPPAVDDEEEDPPTDPNFQSKLGPNSTRPSTNDRDRASLFDPGTSPSIEATFDKLLNDVDASFDEMIASVRGSRPPESGRAGQPDDLADVRDLFGQLAAKHMRPVRDFMIDLKWGEAPQSWLAVSEPAVRSLRGAAERLTLSDLADALDGFGAALEQAAIVKAPTVTGEMRDKLIEAYAKLAIAMPQAFALEEDQSQRESVIIHSLLLQVPGVRKVTIDKLYAAGLSSLEPMFTAKGEDIVSTTGIERALADRIVERFQHYRRELKSVVPDAGHTQERDRLAQLAKRLRHQHDEFEKAAASWADDAAAKKKSMREARAATLLEVNVVLARLGEVERLKTFERLPFEKKVEELEAYLAEAEKSFGH